MANYFKQVIDRQMWVQVPAAPNAHVAGVGLCSDLRNDISRNPCVYQLASATILNKFNIVKKGWSLVQSPALAGTFGAGAGCVFAPSRSLYGSVGSGSTNISITTSTAITSVGANMFANKGGSGKYAFRVRIVGCAAGSSGKTEERWIVANTSGTTPTLLLDSALSFTPISGDTYEILSGRVFMLSAGALASGTWKSFEVAANTLTTLGYTNLPATINTDFSAIALDEMYVPYNRKPGEGLIGGSGTYDTAGVSKSCITATAVAASTITGQSSGGDASVLANEYRNFQIRIVEDTATPTAVGQRRIIASHTAGASPVYTLGSAWTVNPSVTCKFVIENPNQIILWSSAAATTYVYNYSGLSINNGTTTIASDAWSTTYYAVRPAAMGAGCTSFPSFGIEYDMSHNARHSFIYSFRGGATSTLDLLDIAESATGTWTAGIVYDSPLSINTGTCGKYAPATDDGRFGYLNIYTASAINQIFRFDVKNRTLLIETPTDWIQSGTAAAGDRLTSYAAIDGDDKYTVLLLLSMASTIDMELIVQC